MTEKLYYADSHLRRFTAAVIACTSGAQGFAVELDRTAFFPEGGGQPADTGTLGGVRVSDVQERGGRILHYTDGPITPGAAVTGELDWEQRFRRMQAHTGEHIVSGAAHSLYGCTNVGFHMGADGVIVDFDRELTQKQLETLEQQANAAVFADLPVTAFFPDPAALAQLDYRSKLDLTEDVRLVEIEGVDLCACCAPHVSRTGEIGAVRIVDAMRHRGGVRLRLLCGWAAWEDALWKHACVAEISAALSAKQRETPTAVARLQAELAAEKQAQLQLKQALLRQMLAAVPETDGNFCLFDDTLDPITLRELVNAALPRIGGICGVFSGADGRGYRYILASRTVDLRAEADAVNRALSGRGGGTPEMIQGSVAAPRAAIEAYFGV